MGVGFGGVCVILGTTEGDTAGLLLAGTETIGYSTTA